MAELAGLIPIGEAARLSEERILQLVKYVCPNTYTPTTRILAQSEQAAVSILALDCSTDFGRGILSEREIILASLGRTIT